MTKPTSPIPPGLHTVTAQLTFDDTAKAIDWYKKALDAKEISRSKSPDGHIMHAEIQIGDSRLFLNDVTGGGKTARTMGGSPISMWVYVADCDTMFNHAVAAGAKVDAGPMGKISDQFWGDQVGMFADPFGYRWSIATHKEDITREEMERRGAEFFKQNAPQHTPQHA